VVELPLDLEKARAEWHVGPGMKVVADEVLGRKAIEHSGRAAGFFRTRQPVEGPCEIVARIRITEQKANNHGATLAIGVTGEGTRPQSSYSLAATSAPRAGRFCLTLTPTMGSGASRVYQTSRPTPKGSVKTPWPRSIRITDRFTKISPVWDKDFRLEIESAMARIPLVHETWFTLRIAYRPDAVQLYKDGSLVAERRPAGRIEGEVGLWLRGNVRVASLCIRRPDKEPEGLYPVRIDELCNEKGIDGKGPVAIRGDSLPPAGTPLSVNRIPFVFADRSGSDHIDVGESLFHYRNHVGFVMARTTWPPPGSLDPARILLRVPNRPYRCLWVIAASDGEPCSVPLVTARFYRPLAGFAVDAVGEIPLLTARSGPRGARRLPVRLADGKRANLWLVPIELDSVAIGSRFREAMALSLELTKQVHDYRAYPDPAAYDRFQGGLPSGVRIFAMTLEEAPIHLIASGNRTGNVYVSPEEPSWQVKLKNLRNRELAARIRLTITDPCGKQRSLERKGALGPYANVEFDFPISTPVLGLHRVRAEVEAAGEVLSQEGTFVQLPPDTRRATTANSRWGLWWWRGGHLTNPNEEEDLYLLRAAGTRVASAKDLRTRRAWGMFPSTRIIVRGPAKWAYKDPYDPKEYEKFSEEIGKKVAETMKEAPDTQHFAIFAENAISRELTYGILPRFIGEPEYVMNDREKARLRASIVTAKAATEGIRKHAPKAKVSFGWCEPTFSVPFMRAKYPKELMDAVGVDTPQFERMPEMPIRSVAPNRMWILQEERKRLGYADIPIIHTESYFPTSHRLALGPRGSADHYVRSAVLSLALGSSRLLYCFTLHDCADYWGSTHYGCIGITGQRPEHNPKPAFPAYATMTRLLDIVEFDGYVPTGSLTSYCVRFKSGRTFIYCLWAVRGSRAATLRFAKPGIATQIDENSNETKLTSPATVTLTPTPIWVTSDQPIERVELGEPVHTERPGEHTVLLDPLDRPWTHEPGAYERYATNHWDLPRFPGPMKSEIVRSRTRRSKVWQITLAEPPKERKLAAWYGVFTPPKPIPIPGKARALGIWANGHSNWGRIIYEIEDARGEIWQSIGSKDQWNCDDVHSWSYFNFDGWRYLEFPLPNHQPGDNYRERDTVWWNSSALSPSKGEGVVDLPVKLTRIIIEHRTHHIYVNDCVPVPDRSVQLDDLMAVYDSAEAMTDAPIRLQRAAAGVVEPVLTQGAALPNPIASLAEKGVGAPTSIVKVAPPDQYYDGTRINVAIKPVAGAKEYRVYVAAYESGAGAQVMAKGPKPELLVTRLRPEVPLHLFATYLNAKNKESKPSPPRRILLKDDFPMK